MGDCITVGLRRASVALLLITSPVLLSAQDATRPAESVRDPAPVLAKHYWKKFALGFTTSILAHEAGHVVTSMAVGGHPSFGFDAMRPTVYSGISVDTRAHDQFLFSVSGLAVQSILNETILDIPHGRGSAFERGLLAGGIGTTAFYLTIGRWGSVSDVEFIARTGAMTKTQVTLLFGTIATVQTIRIARNPKYANFFVRPRDDGRLDLGVNLQMR